MLIASFPDLGTKYQVPGLGRSPRWAPEGDDLFFWRDFTLFVVPVSGEQSLRLGDVEELFDVPDSELQDSYAISLDGTEILLSVKNTETSPKEIEVVLNWLDELARLAGGGP